LKNAGVQFLKWREGKKKGEIAIRNRKGIPIKLVQGKEG